MPGIHFLGILFATTLHAVFQTNISEESSSINEYGTSTTKRAKEDYNYFVESQTNIVWYRFLAYKIMRVRIKKVPIRHTTPMQKDVTKSSTTGYVKLDDTISQLNSDEDENITTSMTDAEVHFNASQHLELLPDFVFDDNIYFTIKQDTRRRGEYRGPKREKAFRIINARLPYWEYGHLMFEGSTQWTRDPPNVTKEYWKNIMNEFDDCNPTCLYFFETYGKVCGHRYNTMVWKNEYRNFENICEIDKENCRKESMRPHWHPMYRGECGELEKFKGYPLEFEPILKRKEEFDNYSYVPPTATLTPDELEDNLDKIIHAQMSSTPPAGR